LKECFERIYLLRTAIALPLSETLPNAECKFNPADKHDLHALKLRFEPEQNLLYFDQLLLFPNRVLEEPFLQQ
jgi:hypothetical protein